MLASSDNQEYTIVSSCVVRQARRIIIEWKIDELAHAGDEHLDPAYVAAYDAKQQTDPTEDIEALLALGEQRSLEC